jgi:peptidoglycan/LPS O-acetylase OafA/YrhL
MVALITCLVVTIPAAEVFYRLVELPSKLLAHKFFDFITA